MLIILPITSKFQSFIKIEEKSTSKILKVLNAKKNKIFEIPLEEYVWRVAAKEMPLSFHDEAIKAQIVAARTYALKRLSDNTHTSGVNMCTDSNHCTAFLIPGEEKINFGNQYKETCNRLKDLCNQTKNQIITYKNEPILAVFHAISSGVTEKSSDVWQTQLPYLISVDSSVDENVSGYSTIKTFTEEEIKKVFQIDIAPIFEIVSLTEAGGVKEICVGEKNYSGAEVRNLLDLRSNNFNIEKKEKIYKFHVKGYGHGVGMSQTGANEYAKKGFSYKDILAKYYPNTKLQEINICFRTSNTTK